MNIIHANNHFQRPLQRRLHDFPKNNPHKIIRKRAILCPSLQKFDQRRPFLDPNSMIHKVPLRRGRLLIGLLIGRRILVVGILYVVLRCSEIVLDDRLLVHLQEIMEEFFRVIAEIVKASVVLKLVRLADHLEYLRKIARIRNVNQNAIIPPPLRTSKHHVEQLHRLSVAAIADQQKFMRIAEIRLCDLSHVLLVEIDGSARDFLLAQRKIPGGSEANLVAIEQMRDDFLLVGDVFWLVEHQGCKMMLGFLQAACGSDANHVEDVCGGTADQEGGGLVDGGDLKMLFDAGGDWEKAHQLQIFLRVLEKTAANIGRGKVVRGHMTELHFTARISSHDRCGGVVFFAGIRGVAPAILAAIFTPRLAQTECFGGRDGVCLGAFFVSAGGFVVFTRIITASGCLNTRFLGEDPFFPANSPNARNQKGGPHRLDSIFAML
eukprot:Sdes_comp20505_c0_seq1m14990